MDLPPGRRPATAEYEAETRGTGAQYCTEHGFPSEGRKECLGETRGGGAEKAKMGVSLNP